jgi:hypothetical protein
VEKQYRGKEEAMSDLKRIFAALAVSAAMAMTVSLATAQESSDTEETSRFTIDGAFTWMGTWGNDVFVAETVKIEERFDRESGTDIADEIAKPFVTEMKKTGVPWTQIGFEHGKWGISAEFWTLGTDGSIETGDDPMDAFRYHDLADTVEDFELDLRAANDLSAWTVRVALTRALSKSLTLGVGLHAGELENRRNEALEVVEQFAYPFFDPVSIHEMRAVLETESKSTGTLVGPSVDLRGSAKLGGKTRVRFLAAQSILFSTFDNETVWESSVTSSGGFFWPRSSVERLTVDSTTRVAIPVTDARAILTFELGRHFSVGVVGLLSVWFDAPLALQFSQATGGWDPASSTLVFASVGPMATVRF